MDFSGKLYILLYNTVMACFEQILWLWGIFFLIGFALYFLGSLRDKAFASSVGNKFELFLTGWIGVPVHEMGHAVFCVIFRHKITEIKFFSPDEETGTLGFVKHEYNPKSSYQKIGNFFIGISPMLFGVAIIYALLEWLIPAGDYFNADNLKRWQFWLFIYLSFGIVSHIKLSVADFKGAVGGFLTLLCLIFLVNFVANLIFNFGLKSFEVSDFLANKVDAFLTSFHYIMLYALAVSALYLLFALMVKGIYKLFKKS